MKIRYGEIQGYLKKHVWGGAISTVIGGIALTAILSEVALNKYVAIVCYIWAIVVSIWGWVETTHAVYGWGLIALSALSVLAVYLLASRAIKTYKIVKRERDLPDYLSYTSEELYGVVWKWTWEKNSNGEFHPSDILKAYCPECSSQLSVSTGGSLEIECVKHDCRWQWHSYNHNFNRTTGENDTITYRGFYLKLTTEIDRMVRSEEYKNHLTS